MDRKLELERKKAKLQALRDEKDRRRKEKEQKDLEDAKTAAVQEKDQRK
jgi:dynein intermediate chain, cytosolic